ncbi:asparagine synthase (glutamine-hydrolyzing) [Kitasatospora sp. MBT63]|uniref:asparagine synthase (glutamine-hydrolyzing) n=1 Tax=Kitasatospora sp. MBT63 TaxID=1444768 RepID=UPI0009E73D9F|nr:asparagine synthase (glutamine-hydrolyzing) [Kitasatospora sp. MBT63]
MCGIAAVLGPGATEQTALAMGLALKHRGPDRTAAVALPRAALAAARLAVTGPGPAGDQPMRTAGRDQLLVFNGEIHNHRELRRQLPGHVFRGDSDTETLLAALAEWGPHALPWLEGPFAFVHVNRATGRTIVARDRFGVKSLYLARYEGRWYVGSEIKALLAGGVPATPCVPQLRAVLADYWVNGPRTPLEGIRRVLPGTVLEFDADGELLSERTWFEPGSLVDREEADRLAALPAEGWIDRLDGVLRAGVRRRLPQDGFAEAGVLCSGGLDSSLVLALAKAEGVRLPAYVASFGDQPEVDETRWAARAAEAAGTPLVPVQVDGRAWREHFVASVRHFEYPLVHQNSVALAAVAARARADGLRVLFSGEGADELFGGYPSRHHGERRAFGVGAHALEPPADRGRGLRELLGLRPGPSDYELDVRDRLRRSFRHLPRERNELSSALAADLRLFLSHGLNRLDKNLMQASIEVREPFLDTAVASFALNSPLERHLLPGLKAGLAATARRYLPAEVVDREKFGFNFSVRPYLESLDMRRLRRGELVDVLRLPAREWARLLAESEERTIFRLWTAEIWCRLFLAGVSVDEVNGLIWLD